MEICDILHHLPSLMKRYLVDLTNEMNELTRKKIRSFW